jgi:hypothetical protein
LVPLARFAHFEHDAQTHAPRGCAQLASREVRVLVDGGDAMVERGTRANGHRDSLRAADRSRCRRAHPLAGRLQRCR